MSAQSNSDRHHRKLRTLATWLAILVVAYIAAAYALLPSLWRHHERQPGLALKPMLTHTADGIPGDPINIGVVGNEVELHRAMLAAGWKPADPVTLQSSVAIAGSVLFDRHYEAAPVSPLYYDGRSQDFAFEKELRGSADRRHHVRFWKVLEAGSEARPVWLGAATQDTGVGVSHFTGQVTHHIAADIDAERRFITQDLAATRMVTGTYAIPGSGPTVFARNGEGDRYFTDGEIAFVVISAGNAVSPADPGT
jgi:LssY C-terminus